MRGKQKEKTKEAGFKNWQEETETKKGRMGEEKCRNQARTLQTALWVGLILVQMAVVNRLTVQASQPVEKTVTYRQVEGASVLPEYMTVTVKAGGTFCDVVCEAAERQVLKEYWLEDFVFPVTFHGCDSQYFQVGETLIPYNAEQPGLEEWGLHLLDMMGLSPEEYQVASVVWKGEPYRDADGVLCRDARGAGRRLVRDYEVRYVGSFTLPVEIEPVRDMGVQWETAAVTEETEPETEAVQMVQPAGFPEVSVGILEKQENEDSEKPLTLWQIITRTMLAAVGIGVILFWGGLLALFIRKTGRLRKMH